MKRSELEEIAKLNNIKYIKKKNLEELIKELCDKSIIKEFNIKDIRKLSIECILLKKENKDENKLTDYKSENENDTEDEENIQNRIIFFSFLKYNYNEITRIFLKNKNEKKMHYKFLFQLYDIKKLEIFESENHLTYSLINPEKEILKNYIYFFIVRGYIFCIIYENDSNIFYYIYDKSISKIKNGCNIIKLQKKSLYDFLYSYINQDYEYFSEIMFLNKKYDGNPSDKMFYLKFKINKIPKIQDIKLLFDSNDEFISFIKDENFNKKFYRH